MTAPYIWVAKAAVFLLLLHCNAGGQMSEGIVARLNRDGFDYLKDAFAEYARSIIKDVKFPNVEGRRPIHYKLQDLKIQDFNFGSTSLEPVVPNMVEAKISDATLSVTGTWSKWLSFEVSASMVSVVMEVEMGIGTDGKPTLAPRECTAKIGEFNLQAKNDISNLYGLMISIARSYAKNMFETKLICPILQNQVSTFSKDYHEHGDVFASFFLGTIIDMTLMRTPVAENEVLKLYLSGKCSGPTNLSMTSSFSSDRLPVLSITPASQQMVQLSFGAYVINTFLTSLFQNELFRFDHSLQELSNFFNMDVANEFAEEVIKLSDNERPVILQTDLLAPPTAYLWTDVIVARGRWQTRFVISHENASSTEVGSLEADCDVMIDVTMNDTSASAALLDVKLSNPSFKNINKRFATSILEGIASQKFVDAVNEMLQLGTPMPHFFINFFRNIQLTFGQEQLELAMDFNMGM